eukprot:766448-Hanusia_phi.AAC.3
MDGVSEIMSSVKFLAFVLSSTTTRGSSWPYPTSTAYTCDTANLQSDGNDTLKSFCACLPCSMMQENMCESPCAAPNIDGYYVFDLRTS